MMKETNIKGLFVNDKGKFYRYSENEYYEIEKFIKGNKVIIIFEYTQYDAISLIVDTFLYWDNPKYVINTSKDKLDISPNNLLWGDSKTNTIHIGYECISLDRFLLTIFAKFGTSKLDKYGPEIWKLVSNAPFAISTYGRCISLQRKTFETREEVNGKYYYSLYYNGRIRRIPIDKLVAALFIHNTKNYEYIKHKDGKESNCYYKNLQWVKIDPFEQNRILDSFLQDIIDYGYDFACESRGLA